MFEKLRSHIKLIKYIREIRNEYINSKGEKGCIDFKVLTTDKELIIYPSNDCKKQLRINY